MISLCGRVSQLKISIESKIDGEADVSVLEADFDEFGRDLELARSQISDGKYESFKQGKCCVSYKLCQLLSHIYSRICGFRYD